jgi:hypothetical protein
MVERLDFTQSPLSVMAAPGEHEKRTFAPSGTVPANTSDRVSGRAIKAARSTE